MVEVDRRGAKAQGAIGAAASVNAKCDCDSGGFEDDRSRPQPHAPGDGFRFPTRNGQWVAADSNLTLIVAQQIDEIGAASCRSTV